MINTNALDNVIAVVIVILALSLVVQAIQAAVKKMFKIKSLEIEQSLVHLIYYVLGKDSLSILSSKLNRSPVLQRLFRQPHPSERDAEVEAIYQGIVSNLKQLGRIAPSGTLMLDSIAAEDLKKCFAQVIDDLPTKAASISKERIAQMRSGTSGILAGVDSWYGTVMQSFEERYTRRMKTWSLIISAIVVIVLNANFFNVYRNIAVSEAVRNSIMQTQGEVSKRLASQATEAEVVESQTIKQWYDESKQAIMGNAQFYTGLGFTNIKPRQVWDWLSNSGGWENIAFWPWFKHGVYVLTGLAVMTLLLSVGAPFWQDTLESLFGIKNLLRKKSDTQNTEQRSGEGQTRT
jgi:hypothetical protein